MRQLMKVVRLAVRYLLPVFLLGCASTNTVEYPHYRERADSLTDGPLTIKVSALSPLEGAEVYKHSLAVLGMQPVWLEVENRDTEPYWFLPQGIDPDYFPYWEAAEAFNLADGGIIDPARRERFRQLSLPPIIPPQTTTSGFVLTNLDEGFKFIHADFLKKGQVRHISDVAEVPGLRADFMERRRIKQELAASVKITDFNEQQVFLKALSELPCCATNKSGNKPADPLNLVIVGGGNDALIALARRGWHPTEIT